MTDDFENWVKENREEEASILRQFMAAQKWTNAVAAATWGVTPQTVCNWRNKGNYSSFVYRQIYESDWGQERFNPEWPDKFWRCGVGYSDEEKAAMGLQPWDIPE